MRTYKNVFNKVVSLENLFLAWETFKNNKRKRKDVQEFEWGLEENIIKLQRELKSQSYKHGKYTSFFINDPKQRLIHKATVQDRVVHNGVFRILNPIFEPTFISNSFSCRVGKGTHKGVEALARILRKASKNNTRTCFALKCDIKKFFNNIDHNILLWILSKRIKDKKAIWLLNEIIESHLIPEMRESNKTPRRGVPIGNLTSQLFANVYLNELDQFIKHELKLKYYVRYTDDFIIVSKDRKFLKRIIKPIGKFLNKKLGLSLHPGKIAIRKYRQGVDFLGYIVFPHHRAVRTKTKRRILKKIKIRVEEYKKRLISKETLNQTIASYLGVLGYANSHEFTEIINREISSIHLRAT